MANYLKVIASKIFFSTNKFHDKILAANEKSKDVDFYKNIMPENLGEGYDYNKYVHYVPSKAWQIKRLVKKLKINKNDSIFDFGCGKGKAIYEFSKYNFKKLGGIELTKELADIANDNMKKLNLNDVEIFNENALTFTNLDDYNHFFFYDPFNLEVFKQVLNNIIENHKKKPREITLIYMNLRGHEAHLDSIEGFTQHSAFLNPIRSVIYKFNRTYNN